MKSWIIGAGCLVLVGGLYFLYRRGALVGIAGGTTTHDHRGD